MSSRFSASSALSLPSTSTPSRGVSTSSLSESSFLSALVLPANHELAALDQLPTLPPSPLSSSPRTASWDSDSPTEATCTFPRSFPRRREHTGAKQELLLSTHGAYTPKRKISASSIYFQSLPYQVDPATGLIDYDALEKNALLFKPRILICGASAYPRDFDYARLRKIADLNGSYLM